MKSVFRENAVKSIRSAGKPDSDIRLVSVRMWIVLILSVAMVGGLLTWGSLGSVPITTEVMGVYTYSLGRLDIRSDRTGVVKRVVEMGVPRNKGEVLCEFEDGSTLTATVDLRPVKLYVNPGERVKEGDLLFAGARTPSDGKYAERVYLYVPFDKKKEYSGLLPAMIDVLGISWDIDPLQGFIYSSGNNAVSRDDIVKKFGMKELEEYYEKDVPLVELMCVPLSTDSEHLDALWTGGDGESNKNMGWTDGLLSKAQEHADDPDYTGAVAIPDYTLVKATITREYRRPITLLIPALQKLFPPQSAEYDRTEIDWDRFFTLEDEETTVY